MPETIGGARADRQPTARTRPRRTRLLVAGLGCVLAAACTAGPEGQEATGTSRPPPAGTAQRDYWPTAGWRTAAPDRQGMDPAVLDDLDAVVPDSYPGVRSLLVARHRYLVYERYWQGVDAGDGHNSFSVTKSFVSALVGIAWWVTSETGHDSFRAEGFGGQLIQVIPDLDLVVVITSDAYQGRQNPADLVGAVIVSAVTG
jgi:CubicO group peptidase (beta-lactamase class C family)